MGLDFVELIMAWEEAFGISFADDDYPRMATPRKVMEVICRKLGVEDSRNGACLTMRAFITVRQSLVTCAGIMRDRVRPTALLNDLIPSANRHNTWESVRSATGWPSLPGPGWFSKRTVGSLAHWAVAKRPNDLRTRGEPWTRSEVRTVVRTIVSECLGIPLSDFSDDDNFVDDLGMG